MQKLFFQCLSAAYMQKTSQIRKCMKQFMGNQQLLIGQDANKGKQNIWHFQNLKTWKLN